MNYLLILLGIWGIFFCLQIHVFIISGRCSYNWMLFFCCLSYSSFFRNNFEQIGLYCSFSLQFLFLFHLFDFLLLYV